MNTNESSVLTAAGSRRRFLVRGTTATLSATAVALMMGRESLAASNQAIDSENTGSDVAIMNVALTLEWEAIGAYQIGAESGLLSGGVLDVAVLFQSQHKEHAEVLRSTIIKLGGTPVETESQDFYVKSLNVASVSNDMDVLKLAARLEKGAANAYLGVIPSFGDPDLGQICGRLAADETMHWTVLNSALNQPLPRAAFTFGA